MIATGGISLQDRAVFERPVRLQMLEIQPIEQPQELLLAQTHDARHSLPARDRIEMRRPLEPLLLQPLLPQAETAALPVKHLDLSVVECFETVCGVSYRRLGII